ALPFQDVARLRELPDVVVSERSGTRVNWIFFNTEREPARRKEFRQAWSWLIDREAIHQVVNKGTGAMAWDMFFPSTRFFDPNYTPTTRDVEKARQLLAASGAQLPLEITMYLDQDPVRLQDGQILQANAAEVGITLNLVVEDQAAWSQRHEYDYEYIMA